MCLQSGKHTYRRRLAHADTYRHTLNLDGSIEIPDLLRARGFLAAHLSLPEPTEKPAHSTGLGDFGPVPGL